MNGIRAIGVGFVAAGALTATGCARRCCRVERPCAPAVAAATPAPAETQVLLQAGLIEVPDAVAASLQISDGAIPAAQHAALEGRLRTEKDVHVLQMPAIVTLSGQEATVFVGETYPVADGLTFDADATRWAGTRWHVTPTASADRSRVDLDLLFEMREAPPRDGKPDLATLAASEVRASRRGTLAKDEVWVLRIPAAAGRAPLVVFVQAKVLPAKAP